MALQTLNTIKNWFKTGLKPTQSQFWDTWDSFRHKNEKVPVKDVAGIDELLFSKADKSALNDHLLDKNAHAPQINTDWNSGSGYSQLINKPEFKTINGEPILGTGDIIVDNEGPQNIDQVLTTGNTINNQALAFRNSSFNYPVDVLQDSDGSLLIKGSAKAYGTIETPELKATVWINTPLINTGSLSSSYSSLSPSQISANGSFGIYPAGNFSIGSNGAFTVNSSNASFNLPSIDSGRALYKFNENKISGDYVIATLDDITAGGVQDLQQTLDNGSIANGVNDYNVSGDNGMIRLSSDGLTLGSSKGFVSFGDKQFNGSNFFNGEVVLEGAPIKLGESSTIDFYTHTGTPTNRKGLISYDDTNGLGLESQDGKKTFLRSVTGGGILLDAGGQGAIRIDNEGFILESRGSNTGVNISGVGKLNGVKLATIDDIGLPVSAIQSGVVNNVALQELGGSDKLINGVRIGQGEGTGASNTVLGINALSVNTTGSNNTAIGFGVLELNNTGESNTGLGDSTLHANTSGSYNDAFGSNALSKNTTGYANTALGAYSLSENLTSQFNVAIGCSSLSTMTSGLGQSTAIGAYCMSDATSTDKNAAIGTYALRYNTAGFSNTAIGHTALGLNTSGHSNNAIGNYSLGAVSTGAGNIGIGKSAGRYVTTGNSNIYIGSEGITNDAEATGVINIGNRFIAREAKLSLIGTVNIGTTPTHENNTIALAAGLTAGDIYRTSTGILMIAY
ncbi:hypothetical protein ASF10_12965 [Flavobacterium sp. Leaf82]|uniref:hypothetical protein n=1 Tax=unclassified Flavobacterium TaxID=196869 RepID=UPI0006F4E738|nr:hypothetical protein [Flavobacterium sp. Leaf82]KQO21655.1 hypothetical protein ASF10_12965 [Flavobacterium sp. Leaf82]